MSVVGVLGAVGHPPPRRTPRRHQALLHPVVGLLGLDVEVLLNPEHNQRLIVHTARPATPGCISSSRGRRQDCLDVDICRS